ncbi:unnamed protein product [marine sediment metagenome]|uniref:Uncharacterized protein n=1 Tax=marine sediment metagenome TaxID=412755 RepID=X1T2M6_9ZZZZ
MADVLNRITRQFLRSVNTPDYSPAEWIWNPDMSPVEGVSAKYWIITGDVVSEMDAGEKAAVDLAALEASRDSIIAEIDQLEGVLRQVVKMMVGEINILRQQFNATTAEVPQLTTTTFGDRTLAQVKTQLRNSLGT